MELEEQAPAPASTQGEPAPPPEAPTEPPHAPPVLRGPDDEPGEPEPASRAPAPKPRARKAKPAARQYLSRKLGAEIRSMLARGDEPALICSRLNVPPRLVERAAAQAPGRREHLRVSDADAIRRLSRQGRTANEIAAELVLPLDAVERALGGGLAGAVPRADPLPPPEPEPEPPPEPELMQPAELVKLADAFSGMSLRIAAALMRLPIDAAALDKLTELSKGERRALEMLAPFAVPYVPRVTEKAGPLAAVGFVLVLVGATSSRLGTLRRLAREAKDNARSGAPVRDNGNGEDHAGSGGPFRNRTPAGDPGLRSFGGAGRDPASNDRSFGGL